MKFLLAALLSCLVAMAPAVSHAYDEMEQFIHSEAQMPLPEEFKSDFQVNIEDMFVLSVADDPEGTDAGSKLLNSLSAMMGEGVDATSVDTGTAPDVDLNKRRPSFSKNGWAGYMSTVKQIHSYMKQVGAEYNMGTGLIISSGALDAKQRFWVGPDGHDSIVFSGKGRITCRAMETVMCDAPFRLYITFTPQDAESFSDVVITAWMVQFLNEKGKALNRN